MSEKKMKFKAGQMVELVGDKWNALTSPASHDVSISIGDTFTIIAVEPESCTGEWACDYQEYQLSNGIWVAEGDLEAI